MLLEIESEKLNEEENMIIRTRLDLRVHSLANGSVRLRLGTTVL